MHPDKESALWHESALCHNSLFMDVDTIALGAILSWPSKMPLGSVMSC